MSYEATKIAFESLKARVMSSPILLIPTKSSQDAEFMVATNASKVDIVGVLLQEDANGYLRRGTYMAIKLKDCEIRYSAYNREAHTPFQVVSWVYTANSSQRIIRHFKLLPYGTVPYDTVPY